MEKYRNRQKAGKILASLLNKYTKQNDILVLALPRGGVPVGFEIAKELHAPLDVFIVRKLGVPGHDELAMGAIAMGGVTVFNDEIISDLDISPADIQMVIQKEQQELKRRETTYRGNYAYPVLKSKTIILVDDGIATGATMRAAISAIKHQIPAKLIVAVPVADEAVARIMSPLVDEFICPLQPTSLYAVGAWYDDFTQTEDEEVHQLLKEAKGIRYG